MNRFKQMRYFEAASALETTATPQILTQLNSSAEAHANASRGNLLYAAQALGLCALGAEVAAQIIRRAPEDDA